MKISNDKVNDLLTSVVRKTEVKTSKIDAHTTKRQEAIKDKVEISTKNEVVSSLVERVKNAPEIRGEKVERIKEAIEKGQYKVDSSIIARNILRESILDEIV